MTAPPDKANTRPLAVNLFLALAFFATAATVAWTTPMNAHPDEAVHVDAVRYFEGRLWPPELNADGLLYSAYGWSRVYSGDIAYPVLGNLGLLAQKLGIATDFRFYRGLNLALLALTLALVLGRLPAPLDRRLFPAFLVAFPQCAYLFSYVNSDAWGLFFAFAALVYAFSLAADREHEPGLDRTIFVGALLGVLATSKANYMAAMAVPGALMLWRIARGVSRAKISRARGAALTAALLLPILLLSAPLKIIYPLTQGDFSAKVEGMREERALPGFKPSNPAYEGLKLSQKGEGVADLVVDRGFFQLFLASFWGMFGFMDKPAPSPVYYAVYALLAACLALNGLRQFRSRDRLPPPLTLAWGASAMAALGLTLGVLILCLTVDYQPQGRYLYPAFPAILLLLTSATPAMGARERAFLKASAIALCLAGLVLLWTLVIV